MILGSLEPKSFGNIGLRRLSFINHSNSPVVSMFDVRCKVMIVEDAVENQQLLEGLLEDSYDLSMAESAEECLARLGHEQPDLVLLDVGLPGMDGYEVCRHIKADSATRDIAIIFVSAAASAEERLAGYEAGGDEYVTKPFTADELLGKVERSLQARQEEHHLRKTIVEAQKVAQQALISSSELGGLATKRQFYEP